MTKYSRKARKSSQREQEHRDAEFFGSRLYRYRLVRIWDKRRPLVVFIGLNPSTAGKKNDDATVSKCKAWVHRRPKYGGLVMLNLFAYRARDFERVQRACDPIGPRNTIAFIRRCAKEASGPIIAAWGNHGGYRDRAEEVANAFRRLFCLKKTKSGNPWHPLYISASAPLRKFK